MRGSVRTLSTAFAITMAAVALAGGTAQAGKFKVLHSFGEIRRDGLNPSGALVMDQAGNLFGTTTNGGQNEHGTAFELERKPGGGFHYKQIYRFCPGNLCPAGQNPNGPLIVDVNGNLYGTADNVVFELFPVIGQRRWSEKVLYGFCSKQNCSDGNGPLGGSTYAGASTGARYDGVSPLYGVTGGGGGATNGGALFQLMNDGGTWSESVLYDFCSQGGDKCTDGKLPIGGLLIDASGNLFGTTLEGGGKQQAGIAFESSPNGGNWDYTILYTFCSMANCVDGAGPHGSLALDAVGNLLGTTAGGGASCSRAKNGCGAIFKIVPNGSQSQESVLHSFCQLRDCKDGAEPVGGIAIDTAGNLFGATAVGGGNDIDQHGAGGGTVYSFAEDGLKILHRFCALSSCADGELPQAGIVLDGAGNLYGTAEYGGNGNGTIFRVSPK